MPSCRSNSLVTAAFLGLLALLSFLPASGQVVDNPYGKSGPADEEREFVASHVGQPQAPETIATLKQLYAEAAKYYATDSTGRIFLRYTLKGDDSGSGQTGEPLTWLAFGNGLKAGQILLIRLTETPPPDPYASKSSKIIEYTVRWQPQAIAPALATATPPVTPPPSSPPPLSINTDSTDLTKAAAQKTVTLIQFFQASFKPFLDGHAGFQDQLNTLAQDADAAASQSSDLTSDQKQSFAADLNSCIDLALSLCRHPFSSSADLSVADQSQPPADWSIATTIAQQLASVQLGLEPAPTDVVGAPIIAKASPNQHTTVKVALLASTYIQSVMVKDAGFLARDENYKRGLVTLDNAALVVMAQEGGPSSTEILNFVTSLNDCVHGADVVGQRPTISDADAAHGVRGLTPSVKAIVTENAAYWQMFALRLNGVM